MTKKERRIPNARTKSNRHRKSKSPKRTPPANNPPNDDQSECDLPEYDAPEYEPPEYEPPEYEPPEYDPLDTSGIPSPRKIESLTEAIAIAMMWGDDPGRPWVRERLNEIRQAPDDVEPLGLVRKTLAEQAVLNFVGELAALKEWVRSNEPQLLVHCSTFLDGSQHAHTDHVSAKDMRDLEGKLRAKLQAGQEVGPPQPWPSQTQKIPPRYLGNGVVNCSGVALQLSVAQRNVLETLLEHGVCSLDHLQRASGHPGAVPVIEKMRELQGGLLKDFVHKPGARANGGYRTSIVDAREQISKDRAR